MLPNIFHGLFIITSKELEMWREKDNLLDTKERTEAQIEEKQGEYMGKNTI